MHALLLAGLTMMTLHASHAVPGPLRQWLTALDSAPTPTQLERAGGVHVTDVLVTVVKSAEEPQLQRHRAIGLLGLLDRHDAQTALLQLTHHKDPALRATAVLAWLSGPAHRHPALADRRVEALLTDKSAAVRDAAARGLRFVVNAPQARAWATAQRARETDAGVRQQLDQTIRQLDARPKVAATH